MTNETHTQYQRELDVLIDALTGRIEDYDPGDAADEGIVGQSIRESISTCERMIEVAKQLIVRDDLDELVEIAQRLFPDGYKALAQTLSQARTALDDPKAVMLALDSEAETKLYAIDKIDQAINVLVFDGSEDDSEARIEEEHDRW